MSSMADGGLLVITNMESPHRCVCFADVVRTQAIVFPQNFTGRSSLQDCGHTSGPRGKADKLRDQRKTRDRL